MDNFISKLRIARLKKGFSQQGLSFLTGIPQVQISYAERDYPTALKPEQWQRIAKALQCDISGFLPETKMEEVSK